MPRTSRPPNPVAADPHLEAPPHWLESPPKPWGTPSSSLSSSLWSQSAQRSPQWLQSQFKVAQANVKASQAPLRNRNVMEGIRQLHKITLLKHHLDAVFSAP
ncbi:MAG: hypothetical protein U0003_00700 [Vampirovibrionales bacterium]